MSTVLEEQQHATAPRAISIASVGSRRYFWAVWPAEADAKANASPIATGNAPTPVEAERAAREVAPTGVRVRGAYAKRLRWQERCRREHVRHRDFIVEVLHVLAEEVLGEVRRIEPSYVEAVRIVGPALMARVQYGLGKAIVGDIRSSEHIADIVGYTPSPLVTEGDGIIDFAAARQRLANRKAKKKEHW